MTSRNSHPLLLSVLLVCAASPSAQAIEKLLVNIDGRQQQLAGKVVVEDSAGSMLLETDEGGMWPIAAQDIVNRSTDEQQMVPLDEDQLAERLLAEMGPNFQIYQSKNYVIVHNTTRVYARWCSSLLETLQKGFLAFWKKRGADVHPPKQPLAVIVFDNKANYLRHAKQELGDGAGNAIGYYSLQTNRIVMYDLTGAQTSLREDGKRGSLRDITALLQRPQAEPLVATIIHEATHQIAFNCGLQRRYVDNPIWLSEGMAVYFETPDFSRSSLWSGADRVNYARWDRFRKNVQAGKAANLKTLISTDERMRNPQTAVDGYAEAWAWNYFLIKWHPKKYSKYLKTIAEKPLLVQDKPSTRLADFQAHFGEDLQELQDEFYRRMSRVE